MGNCDSIEVPNKAKDFSRSKRDSAVTLEAIGLKDKKIFKERYVSSKGPKLKSKTLLGVTNQATKCEYVCRVLDRSCVPTKEPSRIDAHLQRLAGLEHPHLCKFVEAFEDSTSIYLIYEKADSTTLFRYIQAGQSFAEDDAAEYTRQMVMTLAVAHQQNIVHARLSPTKVIISPSDEDECDDEDPLPAQVKICDMGQGLILRDSCLQELRRAQQGTGSPEPRQELVECMPPEVAWEEVTTVAPEKIPVQVHKLDIWSLGCIVYHMLTGVPPHVATSLTALVERVKTKVVEFGEEWAELSSDARDAVESMLKVNSGLRPTASMMLRHPWLRLRREKLPKARLLRLLRNIRSNATEGHFKRMVMRVIAQQLPAESQELLNIERAFRFFDRNGDGVLGVDEICQGVRKTGLLSQSEMADLDSIIALLDRDGSNTVNLQEFVAGALKPDRAANNDLLWSAFNAFDRDGNGAVSVDEIEDIIRQVEAGLLAKEQVDGLVHCIRDELRSVTYKDHIDFDQFIYIMSTPTGKPDRNLAFRRDAFRAAYNVLKLDCYTVRRVKTKEWNWEKMSQSPNSAYRRNNLVVKRTEPEFRAGGASAGGGATSSEASQETRGAQGARGRQGKQPGQSPNPKR